MKTNRNFKIAIILSYGILLFSIIISAGGLLSPGLYNDTGMILKAWYGNDLVTLGIVVPMLLISILHSFLSLKARLVLLGLIGYSIYNTSFYLFGAAFNILFSLYILLFVFSLYAFILLFSNIINDSSLSHFKYRNSFKWVSAFLVLISIPLILVEGGQILRYIVSNKFPDVPPLVFALDLSVVVPNLVLAAVLIWRKQILGIIIGMIMLIKGCTYGLVLIAGSASAAEFSYHGNWDPLIPFYVVVFVGSSIAAWYLATGLDGLTQTHQQIMSQTSIAPM